jgi:pimeloyl-ACP methyl ester carboxylesterase
MGATVTEIHGASHVVMISHPQEVAEVVMTAVRTCAMPSA